MKITLITICWNAEKTIRRTLDSILGQTRRPDEYLFVDGGSNDGTLEILAEYEARFSAVGVRMQVMAQERRPREAGIPNAWNQALRHATGDIIAMLNADDWYAPEMLAQVEAKFAADSALDGVISPIEFAAEGKAVSEFRPQSLVRLSWKTAWPHPGCVFTRRLYDAIGLYDTRYKISADYDFMWRCRKAGIKWAALEAPMVFMELGGLANSSRKTARRETLEIALRHKAWYDVIPYLAYFLRCCSGR